MTICLLAAAEQATSQTIATGKAVSAGICSPAVTGSNNQFLIQCGGVSAKQGTRMIEMLNSILQNRLDFDAVMSKLDQLSRTTAAQRPSITNTLSNYVAGDNFGTQVVNGYVPPKERRLDVSKINEAVVQLRRYPNATVHFIRIGSTNEINAFVEQLYKLFVDGRWQIVDNEGIGEYTANSNGVISHGEGLGCSATNPYSPAGKIAIDVLRLVGAPCAHDAAGVHNTQDPIPMQGEARIQIPPPTDLYISVGTRIEPIK